ncbi:MAG TPA: tetratricopeptide repeat protein [Vicinamibacteria bacterium]|nr:tetratricopeptide repeat protein [Vicinamibacteria bacterium]
MAKINPVKVKQDADKLEKAGKLPEAIALYKQVIDDNPRDWNVINKVGDLYAKLNRFREAAEQYAKVADFYARDGFHLKAIAIWKKINKLDATSLDPYLNLAELYAKQGLMMEAKSQYQYVVDEYIKRGKTREAGDVLKKMADIDPADLKIRSKLADLYTREGNAGKAVEEHVGIAEELTKKGHLAEALQVLEKGLKLDARSNRLRLELGRVHLIQKNYDKAIGYLEAAVEGAPDDPDVMGRLGEAYLGSKRIEAAAAMFNRLLEVNPGDEEARVQIARVHLQQGQFDRAYAEMEPLVDKFVQRRDGDRAAALLQQIVQKNPSHVKTLNRLVEVYQQAQKESSLLATYSQLTEAYINQGQLTEASSVLELLVAREPHNEQHKNKLQFVRGKMEGGGAAAPPPAVPETVEEDFDLGTAEETPAAAPAPAPVPVAKVAAAAPATGSHRAAPPRAAVATPARPVIEATGPLTDQDREFIDEHLAEGKAFRKYGLVDKAADQFEAVVARFPDNVEARQELREVYREKNLPAKAAEHCLALAEIFRLQGDPASARTFEEEAEQLVPGSGGPAAAAPVRPTAPAPPAAAPSPAAVEEEEFALDEEEVPLGGREEEVSFADEAPAAAPPAASEEESFDIDQELASGQDLPSQFIDDEPAVRADAEEMDVPLGFDELAEEPPARPPAPAPPRPGAAPPRTAPAPVPAIAEEEEIGFGSEEEFPLDDAPAAPEPPPASARAAAPAARPTPPAPSKAASPAAAAPVARARPPAPPTPPAPERPAPLAAKPAPSAPTSGVPPDLARVLEEVDSYVSLGFVDDAKEALREVSARFPGHPALAQKVAELGLEEAPEAPAETPSAFAEEPDLASELGDVETAPAALDDPLGELGLEGPPSSPEPASAEDLLAEETPPTAYEEPAFDESPGGDDLLSTVAVAAPAGEGIDLGSELGELFGAQSAVESVGDDNASTELGDAGLADIFKEFKKGVDKQLGKEDYDTRYNLGIAYKEMGLIDEAIAEFQLAAKDEARILECSSMLGICFLEKGMPKLAIKWFDKGLKAPGRSDEEYAALRYDLAGAHEAAGDADRALVLFTELYGQDANFRDVAAKVRELRSAVQG